MREQRPHQTKAIDMLRQSLRSGLRRPILAMAVGSGKTKVAADITRQAREKGKRVNFIVDALALIDQTVNAFYAEGVYGIGVVQASHQMTDARKPVQICSVQTLQRRKMPPADLVIVDECHAKSTWLLELMATEEWAKVPFIGLSATPWTKGLGNHWDDLLIPVTMSELIEQGYLSPFRMFAPSHPDLRGVKTVAGDFHEGQLAKVMQGEKLCADIVETWLKLGERRSTLCFCVDRAHARKVQERFQQSDVGCGYIDAFTERQEREAIRKQLDAGEIQVVVNVGCLTKGVDWAIGCIILARPTKSESLYVQMVGRGLRVNQWPDCVILDHSDTALRLGLPTDIHHAKLDTSKPGEKQETDPSEKPTPLPKECVKCHTLKPPGTPICPTCGFEPKVRSDISEAEGELVEIGKGKKQPTMFEKQEWYSGLLSICEAKGYKGGWVAQNYREKFGVWPKGMQDMPTKPSPELQSWLIAKRIRYSKGMAKHQRAA